MQLARWAHMHRFLSVVWTGPKRGKIIHISGSILVRNMKNSVKTHWKLEMSTL